MTDKEKIYAMAYTEILELLKYIDKGWVAKVPEEKINFYKKYHDKNHAFHYDICKSLQENIMLRETRIMLANLYIDYWASPEERERIRKKDEIELKKLRLKRYNQMLDDGEE